MCTLTCPTNNYPVRHSSVLDWNVYMRIERQTDLCHNGCMASPWLMSLCPQKHSSNGFSAFIVLPYIHYIRLHRLTTMTIRLVSLHWSFEVCLTKSTETYQCFVLQFLSGWTLLDYRSHWKCVRNISSIKVESGECKEKDIDWQVVRRASRWDLEWF